MKLKIYKKRFTMRTFCIMGQQVNRGSKFKNLVNTLELVLLDPKLCDLAGSKSNLFEKYWRTQPVSVAIDWEDYRLAVKC